MAALAAMRAGAGYVTVGAPASLELIFTVRLLEAMMVGLPERRRRADADGASSRRSRRSAAPTPSCSAPGWRKRPGRAGASRASWSSAIDVPLVIDADGLNALAGRLDGGSCRTRRWPTVLTPHAGELGRLLEVDSAEVERAPPASTRARRRRRAKAFVVLKGDDTLVAAPDGPRGDLARAARPALATAGTGDVLSGVIGAMLAKGMPRRPGRLRRRLRARCAPGRSPPRRTGPDGVIASDVIARAARGAQRIASAPWR